MFEIVKKLFIELIRTKRKLNKLPLLIIFFNLISLVRCLDIKKSVRDHQDDYGIYNNVANIISSQQQHSDQTDFKPSNWTVRFDRLRKMKKIANDIDKYRRLQEYKRLRSKSNVNDDSRNYQFKRRSDLDDDYYYAPSSYYSPTANHYGLVYPPAALQSIINLPTPAIVATPSPSYYHPHSYRKYRPSASRNYYHRVYPTTSASIHRRLSASPSNSNYDTALPYYSSASSPYHSYLYGTGLAAQPSHYSYAHTPTFPNSHGLAHAAAEHVPHHHEGKEVHGLLPIITVIGIGAFMIPLLTTFFTAMISSGGNCCQRQKERTFADFRTDFYKAAKDIYGQVEKAINGQY